MGLFIINIYNGSEGQNYENFKKDLKNYEISKKIVQWNLYKQKKGESVVFL